MKIAKQMNLIGGTNIMIRRVYIALIAFLLTLFPWSPSLIAKQQRIDYPGKDKVNEIIIDAFDTKDVESVYALFSPEIKEQVPDLKEQISNFLNYLDKSEITETRFGGAGGERDLNNYGIRETYRSDSLALLTENKGRFLLSTGYWIVNNVEPEKVGLNTLRLTIQGENGSYLGDVVCMVNGRSI